MKPVKSGSQEMKRQQVLPVALVRHQTQGYNDKQ
jgi:hypothetical protein